MSEEDARYTIDNHAEQMLDRLPGHQFDATNIRDWLTIYGDRFQVLEDVIRGINPTELFSLETGTGVNLDQIGTIIEMPRDGRSDADYRTFLQAQAKLILPERRTRKNLMELVRLLLGPGGTIGYTQPEPKSYTISVPTATIDELMSWVPILRRARPATYNAVIIWSVEGHLSYQDSTGTVAVPANASGMSDASGTLSESWGGYSAIVDF